MKVLKNLPIQRVLFTAGLGMMIVLMAGCPQKSGNVTVLVTAGNGVPAVTEVSIADFVSLVLSVDSVKLLKSATDAKGVEVLNGPTDIDMVDLAGVWQVLDTSEVKVNTYTHISVNISAAALLVADGADEGGDPDTATVTIPEGGLVATIVQEVVVASEGSGLLSINLGGIHLTAPVAPATEFTLAVQATSAGLSTEAKTDVLAIGAVSAVDATAKTFTVTLGGAAATARGVTFDDTTVFIKEDGTAGTAADLTAATLNAYVLGSLAATGALTATDVALDDATEDAGVAVCHVFGDVPTAAGTAITASRSTAAAHLAHGDAAGDCIVE